MDRPEPARGLVLVVEDEAAIADVIRMNLAKAGYGVHVERTGDGGLAAVRTRKPVAVVLDVGLPGMDGIEVCRTLRTEGDLDAVLFVTARDDEVDRIVGLELGADDYITKPFSPRELVARVSSVLRRTRGTPDTDKTMTVGPLRLDPVQHRTFVDGSEIALTATEFDLLAFLMRRPGWVFSREQLLSEVWGYSSAAGTRTVDVHIAQLRAKLGDSNPIRTVRGVGYSVDQRPAYMSATPVPANITRRRRGSLGLRVSLLTVAIAVVTGILAGAIAISLIRSADDRSARNRLHKIADAAQTMLDEGRSAVLARKGVLGVFGVKYGQLTQRGTVVDAPPIVRKAFTPAERNRVLAGNKVSASRTVGGRHFYLEARPVGTGGIVLLQARVDATATGEQAIRRALLAILVSVVVAALVGVLFARRLSRPLRRTARAAHALAEGHRDVDIPVEGPAEVADVADAVNLLAGALSHSEARQREFLMSVSHDLRTPLTAITGYAESLADSVVPPDRVAEVGTVLRAEAHRLERLVGDLLDLARLDADDFRIDLAPVDLVDLARGAAAVWDTRCRAVGVVFRLETAPASAWTDASRVRQVLDGLMENALRVAPTGAPIVLAVRTDPDGAAVAEIRDGGPGLSDADLAVAFRRAELYQRYRGVRQVGTGLGLAIVHGLVTRLGGTVEAGHAPEGGARFTVRLPARR